MLSRHAVRGKSARELLRTSLSVLGRSTGDGVTGRTSGSASQVNAISDRCSPMMPCFKKNRWRSHAAPGSRRPAHNSLQKAASRVEFETKKRTMAQLVEAHRPRQQHELFVSIRLEDVSPEASLHISTSRALRSCQTLQIRPRLFQTASIRSVLRHRMMLQKVETNPQPP